MRVLFLLFIVMPIIEMWLLIKVGGFIGALPTIGLVLLTALIGMALLRYQGMVTLFRARQKLMSNEVPAREMADGLFFAVGGALLLTPGFVTDAIGFACLTPGIRTIVIEFLIERLFRSGRMQFQQFRQANRHREDNIIEGDYKRQDDD